MVDIAYRETPHINELQAENDALRRRVATLEDHQATLARRLERARPYEAVALMARAFGHDMNNALASIMGLTSILKMDSSLEGEVLTDLDTIIDACVRARELTQNLVGMTKRAPLRREPHPLDELIRAALDQSRLDAPDQVTLTAKLTGPSLQIIADSEQIIGALTSLCRNALEALTGPGTVTISAARVELEEGDLVGHPGLTPGPYAHIQVTDDGPGMTPTVLRQACHPFYTTKDVPGAGIGLALVHGVVKSHKGRLSIDSQLERGTTITLELPLEPLDDSAESVVADAAQRRDRRCPPLGSVLSRR